MKYGPISIEGDHMQGTPLFHGTDVPVKAFFEYLEGEKSVERFLNDYPSVNRKDVIELLQMAKLALADERILKVLVSPTPKTGSGGTGNT
ncbi:MAG: DUF433 domain-containing protein [Chryseosolibacter sp.]